MPVPCRANAFSLVVASSVCVQWRVGSIPAGDISPIFLQCFCRARVGLARGSELLGLASVGPVPAEGSPGDLNPFSFSFLNCFSIFKAFQMGFKSFCHCLTPLHQMTHMRCAFCVVFHKEDIGGAHFLNWGLHYFCVWHFAQRPPWHKFWFTCSCKKIVAHVFEPGKCV